MVPVKDLVNAQFEGSLLESFKGKDSGNWLPDVASKGGQHVSMALQEPGKMDSVLAPVPIL